MQNQKGNFYWDLLSGNMKNNVKNANLAILIDTSRSVRRSAANVILGLIIDCVSYLLYLTS